MGGKGTRTGPGNGWRTKTRVTLWRCLNYSSPNQAPAVQPQQTSWLQTLRTWQLGKDTDKFILVGAVWSVCTLEASLSPSLLLVDMCWRLLLVGLLWLALGGCVHALKHCMGLSPNPGEHPLSVQEDIVAEYRNNEYVCSQLKSSGQDDGLTRVLADSLLLCVLQEPLSDPGVPHIRDLLSRLESVSLSLEKADLGSEVTPAELDGDSTLTDKVKLICTYLQQRMRLLCALVQVQEDFEDSVKDIHKVLDGLWVQLEELHTGVTFNKEGSRGHKDLASTQTDARTLLAILGYSKNRLQFCQTNLKDSTQLLQELTWSHAHMNTSVNSSSESVWPELLLQSNMEQFDKVQESFFSLEQQTSTFQAHLEGLEKGTQERNAKSDDGSSDCRKSTSSEASISSAEVPSPQKLSALKLSSITARTGKLTRRK
ncbi:uncharacterized protein si:ch211-151h10.2 isoform X2 [Antennarius striatus]|uniref:uncharacterized protein si:ch211-151h10.2 isoform X2 n=1 Tax=Antennarius striatus TaxID=241820 RepID=UPI0035ADC51C